MTFPADTGVLLVAHGTVENLDDLGAFVARIRHGRPAPAGLVEELRSRYEAIGGSPLLHTTRAQAQALADPQNANAWYWHAYALGRYSQGISVANALARGLGSKVKDSLEKTIRLQPHHVGAHIALGAFHAEVIDKVGPLIGSMTYGVRKDVGLKLLQEALRLNPGSAIAMVEYANALVMLDGEPRMAEATRLYEQAAAAAPLDAMEHLDADMARAELDS